MMEDFDKDELLKALFEEVEAGFDLLNEISLQANRMNLPFELFEEELLKVGFVARKDKDGGHEILSGGRVVATFEMRKDGFGIRGPYYRGLFGYIHNVDWVRRDQEAWEQEEEEEEWLREERREKWKRKKEEAEERRYQEMKAEERRYQEMKLEGFTAVPGGFVCDK